MGDICCESEGEGCWNLLFTRLPNDWEVEDVERLLSAVRQKGRDAGTPVY